MHILLLTQYYTPEEVGPSIFLAELVADLRSAGHRITVLTSFPNYPSGVVPPPYQGKVFQRESVNGVDVIRTYIYATARKEFVARVLNFGSFVASSLIGGIIAAPRVDMIYAVLPPLPLGVTALVLAWLKSSHIVVNLQDIHPDIAIATGVLRNQRAIQFFRMMERWIYRRADKLVVISDGFRENLLNKGVPKEKIRVVPNWADPAFIRPHSPDPILRKEWGEGQFVVCYSGGITHNSCLEPLLEAADILRAERFVFAIYGDGVKKQKLQDIARVRRLQNIRFGPFVSLPRYPVLLSSADCNVVTLNHAAANVSVPSKLMKMMASGRPVLAIAPRESEIARVVRAAQCGVCIHPDQPLALASALRYARANWDEFEEMGRKGRQYVQKHLARSLCTSQIEQVLREG